MRYNVSAVSVASRKSKLSRSDSIRNLKIATEASSVASQLQDSQELQTPLSQVVEEGLKLAADQDSDVWEHLQTTPQQAGVIRSALEGLVALVNAYDHFNAYKESTANANAANYASQRSGEYKALAAYHKEVAITLDDVSRAKLVITMRRFRHQAMALNAYVKYQCAKVQHLPLPKISKSDLSLARYLVKTQSDYAKLHKARGVSSALASMGAISGVVALALPLMGVVAAVALGLSSAISFYSPVNGIGKIYFGRFKSPKRQRYESVLRYLSLTAFAHKSDLSGLSRKIYLSSGTLKSKLQEDFNLKVGDHLVRHFLSLPDSSDVNCYINPEERDIVLGMATDAFYPEAKAYFKTSVRKNAGSTVFKSMLTGPPLNTYSPVAAACA
jgi:hypothetical protein